MLQCKKHAKNEAGVTCHYGFTRIPVVRESSNTDLVRACADPKSEGVHLTLLHSETGLFDGLFDSAQMN